MYHGWVKVKILRKTFCVSVVLVNRILECKSGPVECQRPFGLVLKSEDPSLEVLRLNHKKPIWRNDYVVDLRSAVGRRYEYVVESTVDGSVERKP